MTLPLRYGLILILPTVAADITIEKIAARPLINRPITADFDEKGPRPPHIPCEFHLRPHHHCDSLTSTT